jgi:hypothetical protein
MSGKRSDIFREIVIVLVLILVLVSSLGIKTVHAQAGQVTLKPTDDTYVSNNLNQNSNYGGQLYLQIQFYQDIPIPAALWPLSYALLKFNLFSIPDGAVVDVATLQLHTSSVNGTYVVYAFSSSDNSWNESTVTFNDVPNWNFTSSLDSVSVPTNNQWYNWSVAEAVKNALNDNITAVTIILGIESPINSNSVTWFDSKETTTDYYPRLTIHWSSVVPEFQTFIILPLFMMATVLALVFHNQSWHRKGSSQAQRGI